MGMAVDRMKAVYSAFCFCFLIETASCQVRFGHAVQNRQEFPYLARIDAGYWHYRNGQQPAHSVDTCGGSVLTKHLIVTNGSLTT